MEQQYVYRQRFTLEVIWATAASDDAFDDSLTELLESIAANTGETVIWRYESGAVERMGAQPSPLDGVHAGQPSTETPTIKEEEEEAPSFSGEEGTEAGEQR